MSKSFIFGIVIFSLVVISGSYLFIIGSNKPTGGLPKAYSSNDKERPRVEVKETFKNMGEMKVSDQKSEIFIIKNLGSKPLTLSDVSSSCGCTVGQIIIDGKESEEFGMHTQSDFQTDVKPGKEAKVKVTYRPYVMPVYGVVEREVYVMTNDPDNTKLIFKVKANVI